MIKIKILNYEIGILLLLLFWVMEVLNLVRYNFIKGGVVGKIRNKN